MCCPSDGTREWLQWLLYTFLGMVADALDTTITTILPPTRAGQGLLPSDIEHLSDAELIELYRRSSKVHPDYGVRKLSPGAVAKVSTDIDDGEPVCSEANALNLVFTATTIPVPRVRRVARREWDFLIVMDCIDGPLLAQVWPTLSIWRKVCVAFTLRRYIRQLRRFTRAPAGAPPGPLSGGEPPRTCESPLFGPVIPYRGPFASYAEMSAFFNERHQMAMDLKNVPRDDPARKQLFDDSEPLVLCHQDLNLRNIIVGEGGRLWLIDWGWSGYYPPWFEYATMLTQNEYAHVSGTDDKLWRALIPFICGPYFRQERWLVDMSIALYYV